MLRTLLYDMSSAVGNRSANGKATLCHFQCWPVNSGSTTGSQSPTRLMFLFGCMLHMPNGLCLRP